MLGSFRRRGCTCKKKRCVCGSMWYYRYDVTDPVSGKRKQKEVGGFATKDEAEGAAIAIQGKLKSGTFIEEKDISVEAFSKQWISVYEKSGKVKTSTVDIRKAKLKTILKHFKAIKIKDVTRLMYQNMLNTLFEQGSAWKTICSVHETGGLLFRYAVQMEVIAADVTKTATVPKKQKTVEDLENAVDIPKYLEKEELAKFLSIAYEFGNPQDYPMFLTLAYTGLRGGELTALKWSDIDYVEKKIDIKKTHYRVKGVPRTYILQTPKTKSSEREVDVDDIVIEALKKHQASQKIVKMDGSSLVFVNEKTKPGQNLSSDDLLRRMRVLLDLAELPTELTPHSLRHTHASLSAEAGVSIDQIMHRLGHSDDKVTRNIYAHVTKTRKKEASQKFADLMKSF
jgi:integrase